MLARYALAHGKRSCFISCRYLSNHYTVLGVPKSATKSEIKSAYLGKARTCHPDHQPGDERKAKEWQKLQEAHDVLSDKTKRQIYDNKPGGTSYQQPRSYQASQQQSYKYKQSQQYYQGFSHPYNSRSQDRPAWDAYEQARRHQESKVYEDTIHQWIQRTRKSRENSGGNGTESGWDLLVYFIFIWYLISIFGRSRQDSIKEQDINQKNTSSDADSHTESEPVTNVKSQGDDYKDYKTRQAEWDRLKKEEIRRKRREAEVEYNLHKHIDAHQAQKDERMRLYEVERRKQMIKEKREQKKANIENDD